MISEKIVEALRRRLLEHYDRHGRDLPWRRTPDPYRVLVSEVMLQQTRVEAVIPYYERWLRRFPTLESLAGAALDDVLAHWQGLGYYSRARNLQRAALAVRERHAGDIPAEASALRALPGVGEYTAGAVASIAFGARVPAVDGNVRRVLARIFDRTDPAPGWLRETAAALVDPQRPGDFNQALMELGATVCTPKPACERCPVAGVCEARANGTARERPAPKPRTKQREVAFACGVALHGGRVLLVRRAGDGLLGGMWETPGAEVQPGESHVDVAARALQAAGVPCDAARLEPLAPVRHSFTHLRATYHPFLLVRTGRVARRNGAAAWVPLDDLSRFALPAAQRRIVEALRSRTAASAPRHRPTGGAARARSGRPRSG